MTYEIYQLMDSRGSRTLDVFVVYQTITDSVVEINNREMIQKWLDENGIRFDLDHPTEVMDYRSYNELTI